MPNIKSSEKSFGIVFSIFFIILYLYFYIKNETSYLILIYLSILFLFFAYFFPKVLYSLNKAWIKFGELLGKIVAPIVMFFLYFTIIFATSILLKIFKKDILDLNIDKKSVTFWKKRDKKIGNMSKQF